MVRVTEFGPPPLPSTNVVERGMNSHELERGCTCTHSMEASTFALSVCLRPNQQCYTYRFLSRTGRPGNSNNNTIVFGIMWGPTYNKRRLGGREASDAGVQFFFLLHLEEDLVGKL